MNNVIPPLTARVEVKSSWASKINWVQIGSALLATAMALVSGHAVGFDDATTVKVMGALTLIQSIATVIIKTYFTATVTPQSLPAPK